jgi:spore germination cell wall hydrolase CwlJ-like protein
VLVAMTAQPGLAEPLPDVPVSGHDEDVKCLASAIAHEAGYERLEGKQAVAEVVLNRLRSPHFPKTVCGVIFAGSARKTGCQFTFTCDGSLGRNLPAAILEESRQVAEAALDGRNPLRVGGATHYHADYVTPYWAASLVEVTKIGAHIFYRGQSGATAARAPGTVARSILTSGVPAVPIRGFAPWGLPMTRSAI